MKDFNQTIDDIRRNPVELYKTITLDLSTARTEQLFPIVGNYFMIIDGTDINVNIKVRFNLGSADALTLKKRQGFKIPFYSVYLTNTAQASKSITIAYGISESPLEFIDQSSLVDVSTVGSITAAVDISDRAARLIGHTYNPNTISKWSVRATNQQAGVLLDTSNSLTTGFYKANIIVAATGSYGPTAWALQHRNTGNSSNVCEYPLAAGQGGGVAPVASYGFEIKITYPERMRIELFTAVPDTVAATLIMQYQGT